MNEVKIGCVALVHCQGGIVGINCSKGRGHILPGGKWDTGETFIGCAKRELFEETGLIGRDFKLVFHGMSEEGYYTYGFTCEVDNYEPINSREGDVVITTWGDLMQSKFGGWYELLHQVLGY